MAKLNIRIPSRRIGRIWRGTIVGILIGVVSGLGAIVFNFLLQTGTRVFTHDLVNLVLGARSANLSWVSLSAVG